MRLKRFLYYLVISVLLSRPCYAIAEEAQNPVLHLIPTDSLFPPLLADPQTPIPSLKYYSTTNRESLMGKISAGATFGLMRLEAGRTAIQLNIEGGLFSRFDLYDLVSAETVDYRLGFSLDIAQMSSSNGWAFQIAPYHTSGHLLDDHIFRNATTDPNVFQGSPAGQIVPPNDYSRDAVRVLGAYRFSPLNRIYTGMAYTHDGINRRSLINYQAGSEFFTPAKILLGREFRLYLAEDLQVKQETDWNLNLNAQAGLSIRNTEEHRGLRIAVEYFAGNAVEGQFFHQKEQNVGLAAFFDL
jgi:hypothetical protein